MNRKFFTSESVTEGHPDKICDQVSDAVLDAILEKDPLARVACETVVTTGMVMIMPTDMVIRAKKILKKQKKRKNKSLKVWR